MSNGNMSLQHIKKRAPSDSHPRHISDLFLFKNHNFQLPRSLGRCSLHITVSTSPTANAGGKRTQGHPHAKQLPGQYLGLDHHNNYATHTLTTPLLWMLRTLLIYSRGCISAQLKFRKVAPESFYEEPMRIIFALSERGTSVAWNHSQMCWCSATQMEKRQGPSHTLRQAVEMGGSKGTTAPSPRASHCEPHTYSLSNSRELNLPKRL